jgi:hypothetical protein
MLLGEGGKGVRRQQPPEQTMQEMRRPISRAATALRLTPAALACPWCLAVTAQVEPREYVNPAGDSLVLWSCPRCGLVLAADVRIVMPPSAALMTRRHDTAPEPS